MMGSLIDHSPFGVASLSWKNLRWQNDFKQKDGVLQPSVAQHFPIRSPSPTTGSRPTKLSPEAH
jgi:hypothetical protein